MARKLKPGEQTRIVGKRVVLRRPDEVTVAEDERWLLVKVTGWGKGRWVSCKLFRKDKGPKNVYYVGVDSVTGKLNNTRDCKAIERYHPELIVWIAQNVRIDAEQQKT